MLLRFRILFSIPTDFVLNFSGVTTVIYGPYTGKKDNFISKLWLKQTLFFVFVCDIQGFGSGIFVWIRIQF